MKVLFRTVSYFYIMLICMKMTRVKTVLFITEPTFRRRTLCDYQRLVRVKKYILQVCLQADDRPGPKKEGTTTLTTMSAEHWMVCPVGVRSCFVWGSTPEF